jgi:hypothetical protein
LEGSQDEHALELAKGMQLSLELVEAKELPLMQHLVQVQALVLVEE